MCHQLIIKNLFSQEKRSVDALYRMKLRILVLRAVPNRIPSSEFRVELFVSI